MSDNIRTILSDRHDMDDYLIHFIHNNDDLTSFEVLKSILDDGYIRAGWAKRGAKRTVMGRTPAVCFTEMPLSAFFDYVDKREDFEKINSYAVCIWKPNMFNLGARNVIYGTTNYAEEKEHPDGHWYIDNLPEDEMYRYMLTEIKIKNDWTHEREWRWADIKELTDGRNILPIWYNESEDPKDFEYGTNSRFGYERIIVIVKKDEELEEVLGILRSKMTNKKFIQERMRATRVISRESIEALQLEKPFRFRDLFDYKLFKKM